MIQTDRNMVYAYHGPNVTKRFCDFFFLLLIGGEKTDWASFSPSLLWKGNKPSSWWVWFCLPMTALSWAQSEFVEFWGSDYDLTPPKKTKQKNPQMAPFQTHVQTPTQQWFNVWRCCILLSHPPLVIPLQYQVWLKVSQKLRLWGWQWGFQIGVRKGSKDEQKPHSRHKLLGYFREGRTRQVYSWLSYSGKGWRRNIQTTVFIWELFSAQQPSN